MPVVLDAAVNHYERQARIAALTLAGARRAADVSLDRVVAVVTAAQVQAATEAERAVDEILTEQGIDAVSAYALAPESLAGVASDGRDLRSLLALAQTADQFDTIVETQLADVGRQATTATMTARPQVSGYVRMVEPGACSRCIILAGRWYRWSTGFDRHPRCRCTHIPSQENVAGDYRTDPAALFESMSAAEQDKAFGKAGAEAIRAGADMGQVVNARRGMRTAQMAGREVTITREGRTRREVAYKAERLMPETILQIADDRQDAVRLLSLYGYIR